MTRTIRLLLLGLSLASCAQLSGIADSASKAISNPATKGITGSGTDIATQTGVISSADAEKIKKISNAVSKTFEDITPEQERYLGRAVSAELLSKYPVSKNAQGNNYLNLIGKTIVLASEKPETYATYHFTILDSSEINAFAAPSGFIFVTKGMIKLCQNEDDLAAVLAHEIAHVQNSHALKSIKTSRLTGALTIIATEGAKSAVNNSSFNQLTEHFEGSIEDMTQTLTNSGYGRSLESEADKTAVELLQKTGYDANGLIRVLERLKAKTKPGNHDFTATHPDTDDRIADVKDSLSDSSATLVSAKRTARFNKMLGRL